MAIERTAPEMASTVNWLEKFMKDPNSIQLEPILNGSGNEIIELDTTIKQNFVLNWVSRSNFDVRKNLFLI